MDKQAIEKFIEQLVKDKDFPDISPEVHEEIKRDLLRRVDDFIAARVIAALSDENVVKFEEMLKSGKPEAEVQAFVTTNIPDFTSFLTQTLLEFRGVYLGEIPVPEQ
ncbi:hypothetical protein A2617_00905 [Candidatus Daviesbacteria bacterium RIFOXYD1_FULL_41_10]|uniref:Uncharacterized protein n=2 Tax=Candidatus Daviesiibacteriota TaxID=1752718 RepID=A0A1F5N2E4_9BACT|nr:MAG: hypothetical protein UU67_C0065G0002 [Candidatus Daviesbacteria bacterium GW2011_GWB1_41_5]OGE71804.1 MAG: hypothetical protein A2617_00905 [Candidatus Daviesbacteria bacterium RIFOXYD1_FULL_41_10]